MSDRERDNRADAARRTPRRAQGNRRLWRSPRSLSAEVDDLGRRLAQVESELAQERRLHRRVAELTDVVQQLLVSEVRGNDPTFEARLDEYERALGHRHDGSDSQS